MNNETATSRTQYYSNARPELRQFIPSVHKKVLEIGCGGGAFRDNLSPSAEIWGIEPVSEFAEAAKSKMHRVLCGTFAEVHCQLPDHHFDLVICNDVIEHMADDAAFLRQIQDYMQPNAVLMGSIPNVRYWRVLSRLLFRRDWQYQNEGVLDRTHLRFYTMKSFKRTLESSGFEVTQLVGLRGYRYKQRLLIRLLSFGFFSDSVWSQFAFVARIRNKQHNVRYSS